MRHSPSDGSRRTLLKTAAAGLAVCVVPGRRQDLARQWFMDWTRAS